MEIEGKIIQELPMQSGTSKAGNPWKKREWVLETFGTYPRKVKFHVFGDKGDQMNIEPGKDYTLSFDLESREYNGRWYTDVSVYAARELVRQEGPGAPGVPGGFPQGGYPQQAAYQQPVAGFSQGGNFGGPAAPAFTPSPADAGDDLPF